MDSKKKRKKWIIVIIIAAILAAGGYFGWQYFNKEEEKVAVTGKTTFGSLNEAIEGSGTTTPADSVTYELMGTVLEWYAEAGQEVKEGDLLYVLDPSEAEDQLLDYEVELDGLYDDLSDIQENISNQKVTAEFSGRIEEITAEEDQSVMNGTKLAKLVDDSQMSAVLYFSYEYQDQIFQGQTVVASFPDQMLNIKGTVSKISYVDYVTPEGMKCFAVTVMVDNPGSLTEGTRLSCWLEGADGSEIYAATDASLEFKNVATISAKANGTLSKVYVENYERVSAGQQLFYIDASGYESQVETINKQIENIQEKIDDLKESIETEYTRYADISGQIVRASYSTNRMTGSDMGSVVIYNQDTMEISINVDELDADYLTQGMDVTVYRTTSSKTEFYPATLSYLSLEASSSSSGVSTFEATITINSDGKLSSGVTVYYSIDTSGDSESGQLAEETVLAPLSAICSYDDGYYLIVARESAPENTIDPAEAGGSVTEYPEGYYAIPVETGNYNGNYIQILSGVDQDETLFLRYQNTAPKGGDSTSLVENSDEENSGFPGGDFEFPSDGSFTPPSGGSFPSMPSGGSGGGSGGGMPSMPSGGSGGPGM